MVVVLSIIAFLLFINTLNQLKLMSKAEEIKSFVAEINDATNNIAADLDRIATNMSGGLTSDEADSVISDLSNAATKLRAVANVNPEPTV